MPKLKSLRASVGAYGRVAAGGIVEVDEKDVKKLTDTKRFVVATENDIAQAQKAQAEHMKVSVMGAGAAFAPMPEPAKPTEDEFEALEFDERRAVLLVAEEAAMAEAARLEVLAAQLAEREDGLISRESDLEKREADIADRTAGLDRDRAQLDERTQHLDALAADIQKRQDELAAAEADAAAKAEAAKAKKPAEKGTDKA